MNLGSTGAIVASTITAAGIAAGGATLAEMAGNEGTRTLAQIGAPGAGTGIAGIVGTVAAFAAVGRRAGTNAQSAALGATLLGAAAGAVAGWKFGDVVDTWRNGDRYREAVDASADQIDVLQGKLTAIGVSEAALDDVELQVDPQFFTAAYQRVPKGGGEPQITIGRNLDNGRLYVGEAVNHEYGHHVAREIAPNLGYSGEGGAIGESVADVVASLVDDDWVLADDVIDGGRRSMEAPRLIHKDQVRGGADVHDLAGVPNVVSVRIAKDIGKPELAKLVLTSLADPSLDDPTAGFDEYAAAMRTAAARLGGADGRLAGIVDDAWTAAGY